MEWLIQEKRTVYNMGHLVFHAKTVNAGKLYIYTAKNNHQNKSFTVVKLNHCFPFKKRKQQ